MSKLNSIFDSNNAQDLNNSREFEAVCFSERQKPLTAIRSSHTPSACSGVVCVTRRAAKVVKE